MEWIVSTKVDQVNLHQVKVASAVIARAITKDDIGMCRGYIRGLQEKSMQVIWDFSRESQAHLLHLIH